MAKKKVITNDQTKVDLSPTEERARSYELSYYRGPDCFPETMFRLPKKLLNYRTKFKVIGKNVFLQPTGFKGSMTLREAMKQFGTTATVSSLLSKFSSASNTQLVKAEGAELQEYLNAKAALEAATKQAQLDWIVYDVSLRRKRLAQIEVIINKEMANRDRLRSELNAILVNHPEKDHGPMPIIRK